MRVFVVYKSGTGFTKAYAEFIAADLNGELVPFKDRRKLKPDPDAVLIFGAPIKASALPGSRWFLRNRGRFKKAYAFAVGASPADSKDLPAFLEKQKRAGLDLFYMPGGFCWEKMSRTTRFILRNFFLPAVKKAEGEESEMYRTVSHSYSQVDKKFADPLIQAVKKEIASD